MRRMCILVDERTRIIVQGITGSIGSTQTKLMLDYGSKIVAGVTPGKGGATVHGVPVYDSVKAAVSEHPADVSMLLVPAPFIKDAAVEAMDSGMKLLVAITEHVPVHDAVYIREQAEFLGVRVIGPTTPGIICPGKTKIGIMPASVFMEGNVGIISRSGTLLYEIAGNLTFAGIGQSTCVGIGADPVVGIDMVDILRLFEKDEHTKLVAIVGEIGGVQEEEAAQFIREMKKPVVAYVAGRVAPPGERMGHAGAIILRGRGTAQSKIDVLRSAGVKVANRPSDVVTLTKTCI
jgi:succinyl-CoA synthetase alpha subunit